jgi:predicted DNA-binding protein (UPF0251 family)
MPRPGKFRRICCKPAANYYKPRGIPLSVLEQINLTFDELEAMRLADLEGLYQEKAAEQMNVSRQTFGRIIDSAHKKIADALVNGKALSIEGGRIEMDNSETDNRAHDFQRRRCGYRRHQRRLGQQE